MPSADRSIGATHADFSFEDLTAAYFDCRQHKRNTRSALASICFVITRPKPREVWAANFRDRIAHHLLYNHVAPRFYASFIADSCACIPDRGTLYAARRLESKVRSVTQNWRQPAFYLKCDLANFFVSIDKQVLAELLAAKITEPWWRWLAETILFHDPREAVEVRGAATRLSVIPPHKSLFQQPAGRGLPIGNLSSQFFANVLLNVLDQHVKHRIGARHYIRYVDDFILLHPSAQWLNDARASIETLLAEKLALRLNPTKTILQPVARGIDFVGQVVKPWRRVLRRRTFNDALSRVERVREADLCETANSYFGLFRQATHSRADRLRLAKRILRRGRVVNGALTKTYRATAIREHVTT